MHVGASILLRIGALVTFAIAFFIDTRHAAFATGPLGFIALGLAFWVTATLVS